MNNGNKLRNLEQVRAANALKHQMDKFPGNDGGEVVKKTPTMILNNGLLATLANAVEKKASGELKNPGHHHVFECVIEHLSCPEINIAAKTGVERFLADLCGDGKGSAELRAVTAETMAYLNYLRRFARSK